MRKPSWKIRRRYVFAAFTLGFGMIVAAIIGIWSDKSVGDLVTGGVALISLILTSYIFGAVWEDRSQKAEENPDG